MSLPNLRFVGPLFALFLSACSDDYHLLAVAKEGRISFVREVAWFENSNCLYSFEVRADDGRFKTMPDPGDNEALVQSRGVYWSAAPDPDVCRDRFPVAYGEKLGKRLPDNFPFVAAKPLTPGLIYEVWAPNKVSGSGRGWFRILPEGGVENYRTDPTPVLRDEDGWQVF